MLHGNDNALLKNLIDNGEKIYIFTGSILAPEALKDSRSLAFSGLEDAENSLTRRKVGWPAARLALVN